MKSVPCNRSSNLSSRACVGVISCGYHTGENRNQILSRVVFPFYSLGGILPQECFSGQKPMALSWLTVVVSRVMRKFALVSGRNLLQGAA